MTRSAGPLTRLADGLGRSAGLLLDSLLPPECLTCDAEVTVQGTLCAVCFAGLSFIAAPLCEHCGVPFAHEGQALRGPAGEALCPGCAACPPVYDACRAALRYDEAAKRLVLPLKHADRTQLAAPLARHMARAGAVLLRRADLIVPVPVHWRRLLARRFNQAALLARNLSRLSSVPWVPDLLRRLKNTPSLGDRSAGERASLLAGAFVLRGGMLDRIRGRRVLLVDDVVTSGATVEASARVLLAGGAAAVDVLAVARVPDPRLRDV